jgi:hypothetical protein
MKIVLLVLALAACGGKTPPAKDPDPVPGGGGGGGGPVKDTRTELEKRRDAACDNVGKLSASCAVEDAKKDLAAGKTKKDQFDLDTKPEVVAKLAVKYADECKSHKDYSSRQVRVLEKCPQYETECGPLMECLHNVQPPKK